VSGEEYPAATGGGCLLLYVRGAGVAAGDGDGDVVEAASSMEEGDHTGIGEAAESVTHFGGEFFGVVGVNGNKERVEFLQHVAELRSDALRKKNWDTRTNSDELDVWDFVKTSE